MENKTNNDESVSIEINVTKWVANNAPDIIKSMDKRTYKQFINVVSRLVGSITYRMIRYTEEWEKYELSQTFDIDTDFNTDYMQSGNWCWNYCANVTIPELCKLSIHHTHKFKKVVIIDEEYVFGKSSEELNEHYKSIDEIPYIYKYWEYNQGITNEFKLPIYVMFERFGFTMLLNYGRAKQMYESSNDKKSDPNIQDKNKLCIAYGEVYY